MIDPKQITNFDRTDEELQEFWLFSYLVAGKNSDVSANLLARLLEDKPDGVLPLDYLCGKGRGLRSFLVKHRSGQYKRTARMLRESHHLDLRRASRAELMAVHGIGTKTSRLFILHSRRNANCAALDTHILKWLSATGCPGVPQDVPQNEKVYGVWENFFIRLAGETFPKMPIADVDLFIWKVVSGRSNDYLPFWQGAEVSGVA